MQPYSMSGKSALGEFYGWYEYAESYMKSAASKRLIPHPQLALSFLQMAAEFTFKAIILSLTGRPLPSRNPYVLSTRCRRLLPKLRLTARLYSPQKQALLRYLDPVYCQENKPVLPAAAEWKQLLQLVRQLQKVAEELCREKIYREFK